MPSFSERMQLKGPKSLQVNSMDSDLKNQIWNLLYAIIFHRYREDAKLTCIYLKFWAFYLKKPIDEIPQDFKYEEKIKQLFFSWKWNEVYDFLEYIIDSFNGEFNTTTDPNLLKDRLNDVLKEENSAYRLIEGKFSPIRSEVEIESIESAAKSPFNSVNTHLSEANSFLSQKPFPDCRNSIKESISAVESLCKIIVKKDSAILTDALKVLETEWKIPHQLRCALNNLYNYTSGEQGIRHGLTEKSETPTLSDAQFMLVACSAFINYLIGKAVELNISLQQKTPPTT